MIPELERHCGSWMVVERRTGKAVLEVFRADRRIVEAVNQERYEVLTTLQYLTRINERIKRGDMFEYEATHLRDRRWAVKPKGKLGTCGWIQGIPWDVVYVTASSAAQALQRAKRIRARYRIN